MSLVPTAVLCFNSSAVTNDRAWAVPQRRSQEQARHGTDNVPVVKCRRSMGTKRSLDMGYQEIRPLPANLAQLTHKSAPGSDIILRISLMIQRTNVIASASTSSWLRVEASNSASNTDRSKCFMPASFANRVARRSIFLLKLDACTISWTAATAVGETIGQRSYPET